MTAGAPNDLRRIAHDRLHPSIRDPNYLVLRSRRIRFQQWIGQLPAGTLTVLDIGARYQPYRPLFSEERTRYFSCDIQRTELVDVVASGESLPFASASCDVVICTQVFEYFADPCAAASEIHRVLKRGGVLLMSAVSCAPRFAEEERWRYTAVGIRSVLSSFSDITIVPETSSLGGLLRTLSLGLHALTPFNSVRALLRVTAFPLLNLIGLVVESARLTNNDEFTPNYSVLAAK